jgi:hypothetical protein
MPRVAIRQMQEKVQRVTAYPMVPLVCAAVAPVTGARPPVEWGERALIQARTIIVTKHSWQH